MDVRALAATISVLSILSISCGKAADAPKAARDIAAALVRAKMAEGSSPDLVAQPSVPESRTQAVVPASGSARKGVSPVALPVPKDTVTHRVAVAFSAVVPSEPAAAVLVPIESLSPAGAAMSLAYVDVDGADDHATPATTAIEALVIKHAQANQVAPKLARALIKVESGFRPRATGRNGEIGLMQISPKTARGIGYAGSAKALYDPEINLAWGMKYLARAQKLAGGDVCGTLLRYNAGLDATRKSQASSTFCARVKAKMAERA